MFVKLEKLCSLNPLRRKKEKKKENKIKRKIKKK
jgi:hypothetical protein